MDVMIFARGHFHLKLKLALNSNCTNLLCNSTLNDWLKLPSSNSCFCILHVIPNKYLQISTVPRRTGLNTLDIPCDPKNNQKSTSWDGSKALSGRARQIGCLQSTAWKNQTKHGWKNQTSYQTTDLVGGWTNPVEKINVKISKWESSPGRSENKKYLKPPPSDGQATTAKQSQTESVVFVDERSYRIGSLFPWRIHGTGISTCIVSLCLS